MANAYEVSFEEGPTYLHAKLTGTRLRLCDGTWTVRCRTHDGLEGLTTFVAGPGVEVDVRLEPRR